MKQARKGQAAFEYLVTYGWAFIVIIGAIAVLAYFGFLNPQRYIPNNCDFGEQLKCVDFLIVNQTAPNVNGYIVLRMRNNFEADISITGASDITGDVSLENPVNIAKGEIKRVEIAIKDTKAVIPKEKQRYKITMAFERQGGTRSHNLTGVVFSEVEDVGVIGAPV